ncbi:MAG: hypothetical protein J6Q94_03860 [Clostridia bacterium]|nr:hypothetical protein [Clostridia bacterium]
MRYKEVCDDLLVERGVDFKKLIKSFFVLLFVAAIVFLVLKDAKNVPAFAEEASTGEWVSGLSDDFYDDQSDDSVDYARNRLTDAQKDLYDNFYEHLSRGEYTITSGFMGLSKEDVIKTYKSVVYDHPEFCWLRGGCSYETMNGEFTSFTFTVYCDDSDIKSYQWQAENAAMDIVNQAMAYESDYEKALFVHDYLVNNVEYNHDYADKRSQTEPPEVSLGCSMYGALVDGSTVCQGYAQAYQYILKKLGIEAVYVTGYANASSHAWTMVKLDGKYYQTDVTWDDPTYSEVIETNGGVRHDYFCLTSQDISRDHDISDEIDYEYCTATECNYYIRNGNYVESYSRDKIKQIVSSAIDNHELVEIRFATDEIYEQAKKDLINKNGMYDIFAELNVYDMSFTYSADHPYLFIFKNF